MRKAESLKQFQQTFCFPQEQYRKITARNPGHPHSSSSLLHSALHGANLELVLRADQNGTTLQQTEDSRPALSASALKLRLLKSLKCTTRFEKSAWATGAKLVAGVDEVGRGALCGCVVAGACILNPSDRIRGLRDSKLLAPDVREKLAARIRKRAVAWAVAEVDVGKIDEINIYHASLLAMKMAVERLEPRPDYLLADAVTIDFDCPQKKIIHGDALSASIAAASILAKVHRDAILRSLDAAYPQYGLAHNKGYATPFHKLALKEHGPSPLHRQSWAAVAASRLEQLSLDLCDPELGLADLNNEEMAAEQLEISEEMDSAAEIQACEEMDLSLAVNRRTGDPEEVGGSKEKEC